MTKAEQFYSAQNKLASYDQETQNLMLDATEFKDVYNEYYSLPEIVYLLRNSFKERLTYYKVFGKDGLEEHDNLDPAAGFCMVSSYLIYAATGGDKVWELRGTFLHWWLYHKQTHTIFDITHTQFTPSELQAHYHNGQRVTKLQTDPLFYEILQEKASILAKRAGLE